MKRKGFTLVELVIVIIIVGILSLVAVPIYKNYVLRAKLTEAKTFMKTVFDAQNLYYLEHGTYYQVPRETTCYLNLAFPLSTANIAGLKALGIENVSLKYCANFYLWGGTVLGANAHYTFKGGDSMLLYINFDEDDDGTWTNLRFTKLADGFGKTIISNP